MVSVLGGWGMDKAVGGEGLWEEGMNSTDEKNKGIGYALHQGTLFNYHAGAFCGVLVKERIMKKLASLQAKHLEEVQSLLADGVDKNEVFPYEWTLHYPKGKQTVIAFISTKTDVRQSIKNAISSSPPERHELVFVADDMAEAQKMANCRLEELRT